MPQVPLTTEFAEDLVVLRQSLEAIAGPLPEVETTWSLSHLTPPLLAATIDTEGRRLPFDADSPPEHFLNVARAALALFLYAQDLMLTDRETALEVTRDDE